MMRRLLASLPLKLVILLWLGCAVFGFGCLSKRERAAGASGPPPAQWRHSSLVALDAVKPTLVMLLHPQCPCSRASVTELNRLAALCPNQAKITVLFLRPAGCPASWTQTDLWRQASAVRGVTVLADDGGEQAQRFGAATSGEALLYAPDGHLLFHGGLTGSRGHEGDNAGLLAVAALLQGRKSGPVSSPVYGCPLTTKREGNP